ncbi:MAG: hypothetical protein AB1540_00055 [Bdellovibrionota bacterium]
MAFFTKAKRDPLKRHVHMMHLDGFRSDLFEKLLKAGQLPHFSLLLARGRVSYDASTVDKSETMKVIESYLTSRRDTTIAGWWQFNRTSYQFKNFWLDPPEVINYELGLEFPSNPTLFDYLTYEGETVTSGFALHRRNVPFKNYSSAFGEGGMAVLQHTYYDQAHATMAGIQKVYERIAKSPSEKIPALSTSLLACADEFSHLMGAVASLHERISTEGEYCVSRESLDAVEDQRMEQVFKLIENDSDQRTVLTKKSFQKGPLKKEKALGHFTKISRNPYSGRPQEFCFVLPKIESFNSEQTSLGLSTSTTPALAYAEPHYVLGMIVVDIEIGRLINTLRSFRFDCTRDSDHCFEKKTQPGIENYVRRGRLENSLFEQTLFLFFGDHGMVDTKYMMAEDNENNRHYGREVDSEEVSFLEALNRGLEIAIPSSKLSTHPEAKIGIDDRHLPLELSFPHKIERWQSTIVKNSVLQSQVWAKNFFANLIADFKDDALDALWFLFSYGKSKIEHAEKQYVDPAEPTIIDVLTKLHLKGDAHYNTEEKKFLSDFYEKHVEVVYGGGAKNNAEIFLPASSGKDHASWKTRPSYSTILSNRKLFATLKALPSVGLIFVRKDNHKISPAEPLPKQTEIVVMDRFENRGEIVVRRDANTGELLYAYRVTKNRDPLGYDLPKERNLRYRTYNEWNDLSVERDHYYHNAVAGMGSYLYSTNPAIGDLTLMHAQGWNFGDNAGGHGGLHKEEKRTIILASGPGIPPSENLMAFSRYRTSVDPQGKTVLQPANQERTHPTIVDLAPTVLHWLGYDIDALAKMPEPEFKRHLSRWKESQVAQYPGDFVSLLLPIAQSFARNKIPGIDVDFEPKTRQGFHELFRFMRLENVEGKKQSVSHLDGNLLDLGARAR